MFGESEICDLDVSVRPEEDVFGLEISVDDVERVEVVESESDFGGVELCDRVGESLRGGRKEGGEKRGRESQFLCDFEDDRREQLGSCCSKAQSKTQRARNETGDSQLKLT